MSADEEAISREEQRLLRTMAHATKPAARPRSWSMKKEGQDYKELNDQIHKAENAKLFSHEAPAHHINKGVTEHTTPLVNGNGKGGFSPSLRSGSDIATHGRSPSADNLYARVPFSLNNTGRVSPPVSTDTNGTGPALRGSFDSTHNRSFSGDYSKLPPFSSSPINGRVSPNTGRVSPTNNAISREIKVPHARTASGDNSSPRSDGEHQPPNGEIETTSIHAMTEEEKVTEQERQAQAEQERFSRYLGRPSVTRKEPHTISPRKEIAHTPAVPTPSIHKIVADKSPRVILDITGAGATKAEAGKTASFIIKPKSFSIDTDKSTVDVSVKITGKNAEGNSIEVPNRVWIEGEAYHVTYTPIYIGPHNVEIFVLGQIGHTMTVNVIEGGPYALNTDATYYTLKNSVVGNKATLIVTPMSYIKRVVPLGYSTLSAKVDHVESNTGIKNVSVLGNKEGHYVVSFYPAQPGDHIISVTLNSEHISGSPFVFNVIGGF